MAPPSPGGNDDVLNLISSDEENDIVIPELPRPARATTGRFEPARALRYRATPPTDNTNDGDNDDDDDDDMPGKVVGNDDDGGVADVGYVEIGLQPTSTSRGVPVRSQGSGNDSTLEQCVAPSTGLKSDETTPQKDSGGDVSDPDDEDDELLLTPVFASSTRHMPSSKKRARASAVKAPRFVGETDGVQEAVGSRSPSPHAELQGPLPTDAELLAGAAAVEDDDTYAEVDATGTYKIDELVPDMNAGTSNIVFNPLFRHDPRVSEEGEQMTAEQLQELMTSNNLSADATEELPTPPELAVALMKHQKRALHWMVRRELCKKPAHHPNGGILADDQGFGKTLSTIALMLTNKPPADASGRTPPWGTLIVCPLSLMAQWEQELHDKIDPAFRPSICLYHGPNRPTSPHQVVKYDVVITTYSILTSSYPKIYKDKRDPNVTRRRPKGPLFKIRFFRVVLDEAQAIKNRCSEGFAAAFEIKADRRWVLSGTPIQNSVDDMYSLFTFLRYIIVPSYKEWKKVWKRRMEAKSPLVRQKAFERFQAVLGIVLLRRAKHDKMDDGRPVIELPPRHVETIKLDFSKDEKEFYTYLEKNTMAQLNKFSADGGGTPDYMSVLLLLLRLRQACSHPSLCSWSKNAGFVFTDEQLDNAADARTFKSLPTAVKERLMVELAPVAETQHTCPVCMDVIGGEDGVVTACGHIFCVSDFESWTQQNDTCPSCRAQLADVKNVAGLTQVRMEVHALFRKQAQAVADREGALKPARVKMNGLVLSGSGKRRRCSDEGVAGKPAEKRAFIVPEENPKANPETTRRSPNVGMQLSEDRRERRFVQTAKIKAFMNIMESMIEEGDKKALVFSQWTRMLDLVSVPLKERGISFERLDGTMDAGQRSAAIAAFKNRSDVRLFLISLKAGGCGLNLTEATNVHMLDLWWNPAVEDQAIDRVHRIGQKNTVTIYRYCIKDTVEDRILELQDKKRMLSEGALGKEGMHTLGRKRLGMQELMSLFRDVADHVRQAERTARAANAQSWNAQPADAQVDSPGLATRLM